MLKSKVNLKLRNFDPIPCINRTRKFFSISNAQQKRQKQWQISCLREHLPPIASNTYFRSPGRKLKKLRRNVQAGNTDSIRVQASSGELRSESGEMDNSALYMHGTVRAGQHLKHPGNIIVYGDVNLDGAVSAGGDVMVWGRLRGDASAGTSGDRESEIVALQMEPALLSIAGVSAYGPSGGGPALQVPERACLVQDSTNSTPRVRITPAFEWSKVAGIRSNKAGAGKNNGQIRSNTAAIKAAYFTGAYIALAGLGLMFFPITIFSLLFDMRFISSGWVRVFGVLATVFGVYYLGTAYGDSMGADARAFYVSTIVGRLFLFFSFCMLVATKRFAEPALLLLGFINFIGAMLMYNALQSNQSS